MRQTVDAAGVSNAGPATGHSSRSKAGRTDGGAEGEAPDRCAKTKHFSQKSPPLDWRSGPSVR